MRRIACALETAGYEVLNLGYPSMRTSIGTIAHDHLAPAVDVCKQRGAGKIHFVTHSLGGIVVRQYLQQNTVPEGSRMVMLSPPNQGNELAEALRRLALYRWIMGPAGQELGVGPESVPRNLSPVNIELGVITGKTSILPFSRTLFGGPSDGKVSVDGAKLAEMKDFLVIPAGHAFIMRKRLVIRQAVHFLRHGVFDRTP
jgi:hypothetical protein